MDSNTHSTQDSGGRLDGLAVLAAAVDGLAAQELNRLSDAGLAGQVLGLRRLVDRLEGHWLQQLAAVDGRGLAGLTRASRLARPRPGCGPGCGWVPGPRPAVSGRPGPCSGGPLAATAAALIAGELSVAHARVLAHGTQELPEDVMAEAEPVLVAAAAGLDPPRLRRVLGHLCLVADPDGADRAGGLRSGRRGCGWPRRWRGWSRLMGCWSLRLVGLWWRRWRRWPVRLMPGMAAVVGSVGLMRWWSWPVGPWRVGGWPRLVGCGRS
jgi:hypothetical protein